MEQNILVTIIIPVYNTKPYIVECMESVLHQTYQNLEIILINDGSTDGSDEVCKSFEFDARVRFINRENRGLSYTRQEGINLANGQYFCNLDSDDCMELDFVEKMLSRILEREADIVTCGRVDFDQEYRQEHNLPVELEELALTKELVSSKFAVLSKNFWLADSWNKMYRTEFVRNSGVEYFLPNRYNGTDLSFNHLLILHLPKVVVLNEPLLLHRIVIGSRVHRKNKPLQEGFEIIVEHVLKEAEQLGYNDMFKKTYSLVYIRLLRMVFLTIIQESENKEELKVKITDFYRRRDAFGRSYPFLEPKALTKRPASLRMCLWNSCMLGNNLTLLYVLFYLYSAKEKWKDWSREDDKK